MKKIAIINSKGGVGKTTTIFALATAIAKGDWRGFEPDKTPRIGIIDRDSFQHTLSDSLKFIVGGVGEFNRHEDFTVVFIDTPGSIIDSEVRNSILAADFVLVPLGLSSFDLAATNQVCRLIDSVRLDVPRALVFVKIKPQTKAHSFEIRKRAAKAINWPMLTECIAEHPNLQRILIEPIKFSKVQIAPLLRIMDEIKTLIDQDEV